MSIINNQVYDIPSYENGFEYAVSGKPETRRRFFQSVARWDSRYQKVVVPGRTSQVLPRAALLGRSRSSCSDEEILDDEDDAGEEDIPLGRRGTESEYEDDDAGSVLCQ